MTESFVHDPWSPYSSIANDVLLDFEDGALVRRWLHGPEVDEPLAYERYAGTNAGGSGTALELFRNRLGSVILAVSVATGAVAAEYDYDSFGQRVLVQGTEEVRYGFTAREHDALTGLIHYRARAYDPLTGQFLQRDPIGFASGDLNLYAYVENDPYNWTDPRGLAGAAVEMPGINAGNTAIRGGLGGIFGAALNLAQRLAQAMAVAAPASSYPDTVGDGTSAGSDADAPPIAVSDTVATNPNATPLYRAVDSFELADIIANGGRFRPSPTGSEVKWFAISPYGAMIGGRILHGEGNFTVVQTQYPGPILQDGADTTRFGPVLFVAIPNPDLPRLSPAIVVGDG